MRIPVETLIASYQQHLFRSALVILQNNADAQDAVQDTFVSYYQKNLEYQDEEHIRAWLFRSVINRSKDMRRSFFRKNQVSWQEYMENIPFEQKEDGDLFAAVMEMPWKSRIVLQLFYYEDYSVAEIAQMLKITPAAAKKRLSRARMELKTRLKEDWQEEDYEHERTI